MSKPTTHFSTHFTVASVKHEQNLVYVKHDNSKNHYNLHNYFHCPNGATFSCLLATLFITLLSLMYVLLLLQLALHASPYSPQALLCNNEPWKIWHARLHSSAEHQTVEYRHVVIWYWHILWELQAHTTDMGVLGTTHFPLCISTAQDECSKGITPLNHFQLHIHTTLRAYQRVTEHHRYLPMHLTTYVFMYLATLTHGNSPLWEVKPTLACTTPHGVYLPVPLHYV